MRLSLFCYAMTVANECEMKKIILMLGIFSSIFSGCSQNVKPTEPMTLFEYNRHNSMRIYNGMSYKVSLLDDGRVNILINEGFPDEKEIVTDDKTVFEELQALVDKYGMLDYKNHYQPKMHITDGDSWHLTIKYGSGYKNVFSSSGYMAGPSNHREAEKAIVEYFNKWKEIPIPERKIQEFEFTCHNDRGLDINYHLMCEEDGNATLTMYNTEHPVDGKPFEGRFSFSEDYFDELEELVKTSRLKKCEGSSYQSDSSNTQYYKVSFSDGTVYEGTCYYDSFMDFQGRNICTFFKDWLPVRGHLANFEFSWECRFNDRVCCILKTVNNGYGETLGEGERYIYYNDEYKSIKFEHKSSDAFDDDLMPKIEKMLDSNGFSPRYRTKNRPGNTGTWNFRAQFDSGDSYSVIEYIDENKEAEGRRVKESLEKILKPYLK